MAGMDPTVAHLRSSFEASLSELDLERRRRVEAQDMCDLERRKFIELQDLLTQSRQAAADLQREKQLLEETVGALSSEVETLRAREVITYIGLIACS